MLRSRKPSTDTGNAPPEPSGLISWLANLSDHRPWLTYAVAVAASALATVLRWWLGLLVGTSLPPYITFYPLIMLAALFGGAGPGLLATTLSALAVAFFFLPPAGSFAVANPADQLAFALFCGINIAVTIICAALRAARQHTLAEARRAQASEVRYRRIFEAAHDGILLLDANSQKITDANPFITQLLCYSRDELLGKELWEIGLFNDTAASRAAFDQLAREGRIRYENLSLRARTGETRNVEFVSIVYDEDGHSVIQCNLRDITGSKQAEEALRQSEERFAAFMRHLPGAAWMKDLYGRYVYANPEAEAVFARPWPALRGKTDAEIFPPETARQFRENDQRALAEGGKLQTTEILRQTDGLDHHSIISKFAVPGADGQPAYVGGVAFDITGRIRAEEALRESEQLLRLATEAARIGAFEWNLQTGVNAWTAEMEAMHGLKPGEFGRTQPAWEQLVHPDDRARALEAVERALGTLQPQEADWRVLWPDGSVHWLIGRFQAFKDQAGNLLRLTGVNLDITERKHFQEAVQDSETRLRLAIETAGLGTYERDLITNKMDLNPACQAILGAKEPFAPDLAPRSLHPEDRERVLAEAARAFDPALREICGAEFRILRPDGTVRWVAGSGRVLFDDSVSPPRPVRFIGVLNDITERKRLESQLQQHAVNLDRLVRERTAELQETVAELEGFSYSLVHDMRAPLRAMVSYGGIIELEAAERLDPEHSELLRKIRLAALRMDQLVTDSLNYSKILRQDVPLGPVNLGPLIRGLVETYPNLQAPQADITVEIGDLFVRSNPAALTQVFSNLLGNAVKFVAPGVHPRVRVWAHFPNSSPTPAAAASPASLGGERRGEESAQAPPSALRPNHVLVWVEDNGIGIPKDAHEKMFGMFQRMHRSEEYPGTGIGLALVRKSLERTGGQVCLDSEPGRGSRFCVQLPLANQEHHGFAE